ncbi:hypothetical protein CASFOL_016368 [Castilleja foliolosa]|uniref:Ubiquitin-like protease family profile domain-containing protein n=1 Tax=Castilleja foliolosa TaxID=1961234 RepID=A0ABD3DGE3_9LAMI
MTQDYQEIAARKAEKQNAKVNENKTEKEGAGNVGGVEPVDAPEKDDVDQGVSHPQPAVDEEQLAENQSEQAQQPTKKKVIQESQNKKLDQEQANKKVRLKMKARKTVTLPQKMATRTKEEKSLPESLLSPYKVRTIDSSDKLTQWQRELCYWVMDNKGLASVRVVFSNGAGHQLNRYDICTLAYGEWLSNNLVDTWSVILNHNELYAAPTSPTRFFASTRTTMFTIVRPIENWDLNEKQKRFNERMNEETDSYCQFLFPILHSGHFFVISFNVKNFKIEILDNSNAQDDEPTTTKYGTIPSTLHTL